MSKTKMRKKLASCMSVLLMLSFLVGYIPMEARAESDINIAFEDSEADVNLTEQGTLDWIKLGEDSPMSIVRKDAVTPLIQRTLYGEEKDKLQLTDSAVKFSWNDGASPNQTGTESIKGSGMGVNQNGEFTGARQVWEVTAPGNIENGELTIYMGCWNASVTINVYSNISEEPIKQFDMSAGNDAVYKKLNVSYPPSDNESSQIRVTATMTGKTSKYGNTSLLAATLKGEFQNESQNIETTFKDSEMDVNLTEQGTLDWIKLGEGEKDGIARKDSRKPLLQRSLHENDRLWLEDSKVKFSWTDGAAPFQKGTDSIKGSGMGVNHNGNFTEARQVWEVTAPENIEDGVLNIYMGCWNASVTINVYSSASEYPIETFEMTADGNAIYKKLTICYQPGAAGDEQLRVTATMTGKSSKYGNTSLIAATLSGKIPAISGKNASEIASKIRSLDAIEMGDEAINLPKVKDGYHVVIKKSSHPEIIALNGRIQFPKEITPVELVLTVESDTDENDIADTETLIVNVPGTEDVTPEFYQYDPTHWLYFGWENDWPKSISYMGGAVKPGKKSATVKYTVALDGKEYTPDEFSDNRKEEIAWYNADGYLNSPVSEWQAGDTGVKVKIQHVANRVLNDSATVVFTQVSLINDSDETKSIALNINSSEQREVPLNGLSAVVSDENYSKYLAQVPAKDSVTLDFAAVSSGTATVDQITQLGSFTDNYNAVKSYYDDLLVSMAQPVTLPDEEMVNSYKNSIIVMLETMVKTNSGDYEIRGSAGTVENDVYGYDSTFSHDVPNMVEQFIRDGNFELAQRIMESKYYQVLSYKTQHDYFDAIPKYIIPYATMWQLMSDEQREAYFTDTIKENIKNAAKNISKKMTGPNGLMARSQTLDNKPNEYLVVDNFAVLHGYSAYKYLAEEWGWDDEVSWSQERMETLNSALNAMLDETMKRRDVDWYMCALEDTSGFWTRHITGETIYDGNWLGTTFMMSTFPWDATLRGFDLGGTWSEYLDASVDNAIALKAQRGDIPDDSWGAWWGNEYGTNYNVGMSISLLYSEKYRTKAVEAYEWLLQNQCAPLQWGESFNAPKTEGNWCEMAFDYETWGLGFLRQGLLEATASVKTDGTVIVGRGIPNDWLNTEKPIEWKNIQINHGDKFDTLSITMPAENQVTLEVSGDDANGDIVFNLPIFVDNIVSSSSGTIDSENGTVTVPGNTKSVTVTLGEAVQSYDLTVENGEGSGSYTAGTKVAINADKAAEGKVFDKWVSDEDVEFENANSANTTLTMPEKNITVKATYKDKASDSKPGDDNKNQGGNTQNNNSQNQGDEKSSEGSSVKTGDTATIIPLLCVVLVSLITALVLVIKRRKVCK